MRGQGCRGRGLRSGRPTARARAGPGRGERGQEPVRVAVQPAQAGAQERVHLLAAGRELGLRVGVLAALGPEGPGRMPVLAGHNQRSSHNGLPLVQDEASVLSGKPLTASEGDQMTTTTTRDDNSGAVSTGSTAQRLAAIAAELADRFLERSSVARALVVAMLAGQHSLLLGPPGTAKSELARELTGRIDGARYWEILLSKFTDPKRMFGPVDVAVLTRGEYTQVLAGDVDRAEHALGVGELAQQDLPVAGPADQIGRA